MAAAVDGGHLSPFARSIRSVMREGAEGYLALMVPGLFVTSRVLVAFTGSPKFLLARESLAPPWSARGVSGARGRSGR
jgi:hypothetical protein